MRSPLVYVLVLNYCSLDDTLECVDAIRQIDYENLRLLVIDNASPDGSGLKLRKWINNDREFLQLRRNTGYAGGNNEGIKRALRDGADYIMILNPDVRLPKGSIAAYVKLMESDPSIGALNPIQLTDDGLAIDDKFRRGIWVNRGLKPPELPIQEKRIWDVPTLYGAAIMTSRAAVEKIGGFDPLYFAYSEEEDFCRRLIFHGKRLVVTSKFPVLHLRTSEASGVDSRRLFLRIKGLYLYELKDPRGSFRYALESTIKNIFHDLIRKREHEFNYRAVHFLKTGVWILTHLPAVYIHREREKRGRSHV